jgi:phosphoserine phosphatase
MARYRLVCFDLDGTLIDDTVFIWDTLHDHFFTDRRARRLAKKRFFAGEITYRDWFEHDLALLRGRGADRAGIDAALDAIRVMPGARETLQALKARGYRLAVISGSLDVVLERFFPEAPFDHVLINRLEFDDRGRIAGGEPTPYDLERKAEGLIECCRREGIDRSRSVFVGDNFNDVAAARCAGFAVAFNNKSAELAAAADLVIETRDLRDLLPLLPGLGPETNGDELA